jgi:membrane associated rhomboid family serine protease
MPRTLLWLTGGIALIEIMLSLADRGILGDPTLRLRVFEAGAFWPQLLHGAQPIFSAQPVTMFFSHALLHGGLLHMAMNMTILLAIGRFVSDRYGEGPILPLFAAGAIAGGAVFGLFSREAIPMVGASGAVFAFLGLWIAWDWRRHRANRVPVRPVATRVAVLAGLNVVFYFALGGLLAWQAHLGGFLAGLIAGKYLEDRIEARERDARSRRWRHQKDGPDE